MPCIPFEGGMVCISAIHEFAHEGRTWHFESHPFLGPWPVKANGEPFKKMPGEKSKFWPAFAAWQAHQRKAEKEGTPTT